MSFRLAHLYNASLTHPPAHTHTCTQTHMRMGFCHTSHFPNFVFWQIPRSVKLQAQAQLKQSFPLLPFNVSDAYLLHRRRCIACARVSGCMY